MKQTEERHSESRMREIRPSGSMRGKDVSGHWPCAFHPVASFPTLLNYTANEQQRRTALEEQAYSESSFLRIVSAFLGSVTRRISSPFLAEGMEAK